jgi:hypothetical protein
MAEAYRDRDPNSPQNPPEAVVNPRVRRAALWTYLPPLVIFFVGVAMLLFYWRDSQPVQVREAAQPRAEGTSGREADPPRVDSPGGHNPDRVPANARAEIDQRAGRAIDELGGIFDEAGRNNVGRRVQLQELDVERVESPTLVWVRDGNARAAVVIPEGQSVKAGQKLNITGTVERAGDTVRIRASRVEVRSGG